MRQYTEKLRTGFLHGLNLQKKLVLMYVGFCVIPLVLISILVCTIYYHTSLKHADDFLRQNEYLYASSVREKLDFYTAVLYEIVTDRTIIDLSRRVGESSDTGIGDRTLLNTVLQNYTYTYNEIKNIAFVSDSNVCVTYSRWYNDVSVRSTVWADSGMRQQLYRLMVGNPDVTILAGINLAGVGNEKDFVVLIGMPVRDLISKHQYGILALSIDGSILDFRHRKQSAEESVPDISGVTEVLVDKQNMIIAGVKDNFIAQPYEDFLKSTYAHRPPVYEIKRTIPGEKWTVINIVDKNVYLREIYVFLQIMVLFTLFITVIFFVIGYEIIGHYLATIRTISRQIGTYMQDSGTAAHIRIDSRDELFVIARQFNRMTERVSALIGVLKRKNTEIRQAMDCRRRAEIQALEAQINPHFLYNTLDAVNWKAIQRGEVEISDMIGTLGELFRYSISNIDAVVSLSCEISWLRKYVFLQRSRFNNSFDCIFDIEDAAEEFPVYKLLLQPVIENCITHAFHEHNEGEKNSIFVQAYVLPDDYLCIRVQDNGSGIEKNRLRVLQKELDCTEQGSSKNIGLGNVSSRLQIYYRGKASLHVNSVEGLGTEFCFLVPDISKNGGTRG